MDSGETVSNSSVRKSKVICVRMRFSASLFGNFAVFMEIVDLMKENHKFSCKKEKMTLAFFFMISVIVKEKKKTDSYKNQF
jgi:hypothetical protein